MINDLLGAAISMKTRLVDKAVGRLPEPLRSEASGLRAEASGRMKELAGLGIKILSSLNEQIDVSSAATEPRPVKSDNKINRIKLD